MEFPRDHYIHDEPLEWYYFFGRTEEKEYFHFARFWTKLGGFRTGASHFSFHNGNVLFIESVEDEFGMTPDAVPTFIQTKNDNGRFGFTVRGKMGITVFPQCRPVIHDVKTKRNYYSIPWLGGEGRIYPDKKIKVDAWFDHEFGIPRISKEADWEWLGVKLDCGISIMVYKGKQDSACSATFNDKQIKTDFILDGKHLYLYNTASYFILEPAGDEVIFKPKFGIPYSEVPFNVIAKGGVIGYGMREKTYHSGEYKNG